MLVHNRILEVGIDSDAQKTELHSAPEEIGKNARVADADILVVSHVSQTSRDEIEREYDGPIAVIRDLVRFDSDGRLADSCREENRILTKNR